MKDLNVRAGKAVAQYRKQQHLPQEDLAKHLGITRTSISNIERGKQAMSLVTFCKIAAYLRIDPDVLLKQIIQSKQNRLTPVTASEAPDDLIRDSINEILMQNMRSSLIINIKTGEVSHE